MTQTNPTVYLVDDDPAVLKATSRLLRSAGLNVALYASAQEFLGAYNERACGCLMLDIDRKSVV